MASWITHMAIADRLVNLLPRLDPTAFAIGSVAPDCNIENADWTAFDPPKEITHFMSGKSKLTVDLAGFRARYLQDGNGLTEGELSYRLGYFAHLLTDVRFQAFIRDEDRMKAMFARIRENPFFYERTKELPKDFAFLKQVFSRRERLSDIERMENDYLAAHPDSLYNRVLKRTEDFPDPLGILPKGAIGRKLKVMTAEGDPLPELPAGILFTEAEYNDYLQKTEEELLAIIEEVLA